MFIVRFLRFVCGYVRFQVTGVFIERFLNLASRNGINLWDGTKTETQYTGHTLMKHYKKLRPFAKKTGVHMQIEERFGWADVAKKIPQKSRACRRDPAVFWHFGFFGEFCVDN